MWILSLVVLATTVAGRIEDGQKGLTTYGEPCTDACKQRGFPFTWCHKKKSRNGTFIDRDYCSAQFGTTRYLESCLDNCERKEGKPFYWCHTHKTSRGDWDYCSPFPRDSCSWSRWSSWGRCSSSCGAGTKTRRRRIEGPNGRVGTCSGESEQVFQACAERVCSGGSDTDCLWGPWGVWSSCSISCGEGGVRRRYRSVSRNAVGAGKQCDGLASENAICTQLPCLRTTSTSTTSTSTTTTEEQAATEFGDDESQGGDEDNEEHNDEVTSSPLASVSRLLGVFEKPLHGVSGEVFSLGPDKLLLQNFSYDGQGPDAFFWVGTSGSPSSEGILLPHPYTGKYFTFYDSSAPVLRRHEQEDLVLNLPHGLTTDKLAWISVWCRKFAVDFGHVIFDMENQRENELFMFELTTPRQVTVRLPILETFSSEPKPPAVSKPSTRAPVTAVALPDLDPSNFPSLSDQGAEDVPEQPRSFGRPGKHSVTSSFNSIGAKKKTGQRDKQKTKKKTGPKKSLPTTSDIDFTVVRVQSSVRQGSTQEAEEPIPRTTAKNNADGARNHVTKNRSKSTKPNIHVTTPVNDKTTPRNGGTTPKNDGVSHTNGDTTPRNDGTTPKNDKKATGRVKTTPRNSGTTPTIDEKTLGKVRTTPRNGGTTPRNDGTTPRNSGTTPYPISGITPQNTVSVPVTRENFYDSSGSTDPSTTLGGTQPSRTRLSLLNRNSSPSPADDEDSRNSIGTSTPKPRRFTPRSRVITTTESLIESSSPRIGRVTIRPTSESSVTPADVPRSSRFTLRPAFTISDQTTTTTREPFSFKPRITTLGPQETIKESKEKNRVPVVFGPRLPPPRTTPRVTGFPKNTASALTPSDQNSAIDDTEIITDTPHVTVEDISTARPSLFNPKKRPVRPPFLRRPSLARSTTIGTPSTSVTRRINPLFRRRSSTAGPIIVSTTFDISEIDSDTETTTEVDKIRISELLELSKVEEPNEATTQKEGNGRSNLFGNRRRKFPGRLRPVKPFLRRSTTERTTSQSAFTTAKETTRPQLPQSSGGSKHFSTRRPLFRPKLTRKPFRRITTRPTSTTAQSTKLSSTSASPSPRFSPATIRISDDERMKTMTDFMMKMKEEFTEEDSKEVTTAFELPNIELPETPRFSDGNPFRGNKVENISNFNINGNKGKVKEFGDRVIDRSRARSTTSNPTRFISIDEIEEYEYDETTTTTTSTTTTTTTTTTQKPTPFVRDPSQFDPCNIRGACGPNAKCSTFGSEPHCSCPSGFSGIPRNGKPDPQHGCVRTPQNCGLAEFTPTSFVGRHDNTTCQRNHECVREVCLQECSSDSQCALGERCIDQGDALRPELRVCIKICFYDAHCLAGEFCEDNVCRSGCKSDSNCPFGQICGGESQECIDGCNFNNDCPIEQECKLGQCSDPCRGFIECGTNAVCSAVEHIATCRCPDGFKELNSPYDACVEADLDLTELECLTDSDCRSGECHRGICRTP